MYAKNWVREVHLKNFDIWSTFAQKSTFGNWTFAQFLSFERRNGSQNRNVLEKLNGTGPFWKFWLFSQGQRSTWSKYFLFFFFCFLVFFFCSRFGPSQISRSVKQVSGGWRHQWRHSAEARVARVARDLSVPARVSAWAHPGYYRSLWWRVVAREWSFGPEIFRFCRSGHAGSSGSFCFLNWWPILHRSEGGGHHLRSLWRRVEARGLAPEPEIFRFCRS